MGSSIAAVFLLSVMLTIITTTITIFGWLMDREYNLLPLFIHLALRSISLARHLQILPEKIPTYSIYLSLFIQ